MIKKNCREIKPSLVDYADGALPAAESDRVAAHLAGCPRCRDEVRLLQRSLEMAHAVWREEPAATRSRHAPRAVSAERVLSKVLLCTGAAVCAALIFLAIGLLFFTNREADRSPAIQNSAAMTVQIARQPESEDQDLDALFDREERAARLAMSVQILAGQPGLEKSRADAESYLRRTYADTQTVRRLERSDTIN